MVHELIDTGVIEAGRLTLHREPTELRELIDAVVARWSNTTHAARIAVDAADRITIDVDRLRIERVIANLLSNALAYSPETAQVIVGLQVGARIARISVRDAGPGVRADRLARVFEANESDAGSGFGLAVSKHIVEAHGGRIGVDSSPSGSEFYVELPRG
jgi:two-component system sensor histidine kinase BaeS